MTCRAAKAGKKTHASGATNAGKANAGKANAGKANAGKANAGKANAGKANAGKANAGKANAGKKMAGISPAIFLSCPASGHALRANQLLASLTSFARRSRSRLFDRCMRIAARAPSAS
ncbi:hypothetical protein [Paraburkholderia antibiotica]|uniref:Uncharacterized protein n=1 Tax=Paraburkholderia antibiotica TaxID=2728839 RepID=A0A7Y0A077_9BURK|nr:hypothetical protein [Paraburkholderia antibiotica]